MSGACSRSSDIIKTELEPAGSTNPAFDNLYVKISNPGISRMCLEDPEFLRVALRGFFRKWELESLPTCLVVPPVFSRNQKADVFVLMKSKADKAKALKSELCTASDLEFIIKDVTSPLESTVKNLAIDDEKALDTLFPLRHITSYVDQIGYKTGMVENAVSTEASSKRLLETSTLSQEKFSYLLHGSFQKPFKICKISRLADHGYETAGVRVYFERCPENGEVVAGIKITHADGSYTFVPIGKCKHIAKPIIDLTQEFVKFMNGNKEVEPYDYNKKHGLICWLEMNSFSSREVHMNEVHMTVALPYCLKTEELLTVDKLFNSTSLNCMIEDAKMTECQAMRPTEDMANTLRLGSLAESAPDIFDFDFVQADSQLRVVKRYLETFKSSMDEWMKASGLDVKESERRSKVNLSLIDVTWHHVSICPVEWNRRSKLFYHHSGHTKPREGLCMAHSVTLDRRSRPGLPAVSNLRHLLPILQTMAGLPISHLAITCQHASVICHLLKECKFLTCADDVQKSKLSVLDECEREKIFFLDGKKGLPGYLDCSLQQACAKYNEKYKKKSPIDTLIVWSRDDEFSIKYGSVKFIEALVNQGLQTMVVVLDKVTVSPSKNEDSFHKQLAAICSAVFPKLLLAQVRLIDCVPDDHYVSVLLKFERNGGPPKQLSGKNRGRKKTKTKKNVEPGMVAPHGVPKQQPQVFQSVKLAVPGPIVGKSTTQERRNIRGASQFQQNSMTPLMQQTNQSQPNHGIGPLINPRTAQINRCIAREEMGRSHPSRSRTSHPDSGITPLMRHRSQPHPNDGITPLMRHTSQPHPNDGITPLMRNRSQPHQNDGITPLMRHTSQPHPNDGITSLMQVTSKPGAFQSSSDNPDIFNTIREIVNTQARLTELVGSLASSGILSSVPPSLPNTATSSASQQRDNPTSGADWQRGTSSAAHQPRASPSGASLQCGASTSGAGLQYSVTRSGAAPEREIPTIPTLMRDARPPSPDRRRSYNPRAEWRADTWLSQPAPSQNTSKSGQKRKNKTPQDDLPSQQQKVPKVETYGPSSWDTPQTSFGHSQNRIERMMERCDDQMRSHQDDDSSYGVLRNEARERLSYDNSYSEGMTDREKVISLDDSESSYGAVMSYKDSPRNLQRGWDRTRSTFLYDREGSRSVRYGEDDQNQSFISQTSNYGASRGTHPTNVVAQQGTDPRSTTEIGSSMNYQYGNMSSFGTPSYNPAHYSGGYYGWGDD